jgi:hypothetical protein
MEQDKRNGGLGLVFLLIIVLIAGTLVQDFRFDNTLAEERTSALATDREIGSITAALADFRAAQTAYLATGQGPEFWMDRADALYKDMEARLTRLRGSTADNGARDRYDQALAALSDLGGSDQRARQQVLSDQRFTASDVVFTEALEPTQRLSTELGAARTLEASASASRALQLSRLRLGLNATSMALLLLGAWFVSRPSRQKPQPVSSASATAQMIRDLPPAVKASAPPPATARPAPPSPVMQSLPAAADLCVDLARVIDGRDVPALLERSARILDAKGVIIWTLDQTANALRPTLSFGYAEKVLMRLGLLDVESDNVTSLAFRSMRPQTMTAAAPGSSGAVAVPLITSAGCTGVLSAETREGKPAGETVALAQIISAQFATLIVPTDSSAAQAAEA